MTRAYTVTAYSGIDPHNRQQPPNSLFALFAPPDLLYIVKVLLSLIALLFGYDTVSGERENGTLKLVLSGPVSRAQVIAGKMLGGLAAILLPFLAALGAVLAALATRSGIRLGAEEFGRLALMTLAALMYTALFFALGALVSALSRTSGGALMTVLLLWAVIVFAVPNTGNLIAAQIRPLPSAETHEMLRRQEFVKNRFISIQSGRRDTAGTVEAFNREYDRLIEAHRSRLDANLDLSEALCRISPAATLSYVFTDLAGTGLTEQRRLSRALMDYKKRNLEALMRQNRPGAPAPAVFEFRPAKLDEAFQWLDFALLALGSAALFLLAVVRFLRMDPR